MTTSLRRHCRHQVTSATDGESGSPPSPRRTRSRPRATARSGLPRDQLYRDSLARRLNGCPKEAFMPERNDPGDPPRQPEMSKEEKKELFDQVEEGEGK